jgi:hypothetical protein
MSLSTKQSKWFKHESYPEQWGKRSHAMIDILKGTGLTEDISSYSEYGCGPNKPVSKAIADARLKGDVHTLDLQAWDDSVIEFDFNADKYTAAIQSDCAVIAGVFEYVADPGLALEKLSQKHKYLLGSYCVADYSKAHSAPKLAAMLKNRVDLGWRTHLSGPELIGCLNRFGYIAACASWREQLLYVCVRNDVG